MISKMMSKIFSIKILILAARGFGALLLLVIAGAALIYYIVSTSV